MPVVTSVDRGSPAARAGFRTGDDLISLAGHKIRDVFDLKFYSYESVLSAEILRGGKPHTLRIRKAEGEPLGLGFESYLIDEPRSCRNKCIFCFIDQMPPGMRETLYFKDDDARLSFLQGNYITLTNLSDEDVERIKLMRISPINVSVHTTDPELRCRMLQNRFAGESLRRLGELAEAGVSLNAQIVLCPGWNDGEALVRTLADLSALGEALESASVVPVGLTKFRDGLTPLRPLTAQEAADTIDAVDAAAKKMLRERQSRVFYCSDELYLTSGRELPSVEYYEDFPQLENGVGMLALFLDEFGAALDGLTAPEKPRHVSLATGRLFAPILRKAVDLLRRKCNNIDCVVYDIRNDFFGELITVAGLVTGGDLIAQLRGKPLGELLIIPKTMLRSGEDVFLDDVSVSDVERELGVPVLPVESGGVDLVDVILGL